MLVLVDGYNVTMRDEATNSLSKESMRISLVERLRFSARSVAPGGAIVVVFDARGELGPGDEEHSGAVRVVFAPDADTEIVRRCGSAKGRIAVVTDDMRLRARIAQDVGRHVEFRSGDTVTAAALRSSRQAKAAPPVVGEVELPEGAEAITDELSKLWLAEQD